MLTPESPERHYSTRRRTALVLTGSGTGGAYHAGVLRALHEAGIRVDIVAGRGMGAVAAFFAAIDGGGRLWEEDGLWRAESVTRAYAWRRPLRVAALITLGALAIVAIPLALLAVAVATAMVGMLLTLVGLEGLGGAMTSGIGRWIEWLFAPGRLPTVVPRLALLALLVAGAVAVIGAFRLWHRDARRRSQHGIVGRILGGPFSPASFFERCAVELWKLIRGAAPVAAPATVELGRRYLELLAENLGQPGFRELLVTVHDVDARRDLVFGLLGPAFRAKFFTRPGVEANAQRQIEAFDLAGAARDHALDALNAALALPSVCEPHLTQFAPEGPWRGETHRVCDRPDGLQRLIEEVAAAGVEQIVLAASSPLAGRPHELSAGRADVRGRAAESLASFEAAALRDVVEHAAGRFAGLFVIRPVHNPLGPLDFGGIYDERSDRLHTVAELVDRGYQDAYRQFIEPVVAATGDRIGTVQ